VRIIAGEWKGLHLMAPAGDVARPTTDRVKESMFNLMGLSWRGGTAVDLFAGSGALGLEALSRGAQASVFVDTSAASLKTIQENIERCHAQAMTQVWKRDWRSAWHQLASDDAPVGWVFVDPPYRLRLWDDVLNTIGTGSLMAQHGVVCEHPKTVQLPAEAGYLHRYKSKCYGDIQITLFR
jgi:16S rRNA (guanine966-N2)-methyltransferase